MVFEEGGYVGVTRESLQSPNLHGNILVVLYDLVLLADVLNYLGSILCLGFPGLDAEHLAKRSLAEFGLDRVAAFEGVQLIVV